MKPWELIEHNDWCQEAWARTCTGEATHYTDPDATSYCVFSAIQHTGNNQTPFMDWLAKHNLPCSGTVDWNDDPKRTKEEVLAALKEAYP